VHPARTGGAVRSSVHDAVDLGVGHARVAAASHAARLHVGGAVEQTGGPLVRHREGLIDVRRERGELMRSTPAIHPIVPTRRDDVRPYFPTRRFGENFSVVSKGEEGSGDLVLTPANGPTSVS